MRLSAPVYHLKRKAKRLSRDKGIPLHSALDRIAAEEGFHQWSLLVNRASASTHASKLFRHLRPGDLLLVGSRPGQGKTWMGLELVVEAMKQGQRGMFFTLEYTSGNVHTLFDAIGVEPGQFPGLFEIDTSEEISADFIAGKLAVAPRGAVIVIDYLQLLDQQRHKPPLAEQVRVLKALAEDKGLILIFLSQIDRSYDPSIKSCPDLEDVRLPNPLDLSLFNKACFLHAGEVRFHTPR
jgi:replicative DNA helicase